VDKLDAAVKARAEAHGFTFVDPRSAFKPHEVCASEEWLNGQSNPLEKKLTTRTSKARKSSRPNSRPSCRRPPASVLCPCRRRGQSWASRQRRRCGGRLAIRIRARRTPRPAARTPAPDGGRHGAPARTSRATIAANGDPGVSFITLRSPGRGEPGESASGHEPFIQPLSRTRRPRLLHRVLAQVTACACAHVQIATIYDHR